MGSINKDSQNISQPTCVAVNDSTKPECFRNSQKYVKAHNSILDLVPPYSAYIVLLLYTYILVKVIYFIPSYLKVKMVKLCRNEIVFCFPSDCDGLTK